MVLWAAKTYSSMRGGGVFFFSGKAESDNKNELESHKN